MGYLEESFPRLEVLHEKEREERKAKKKKRREARKFPNLRPVLFLRSSCASRKMPSIAKKKKKKKRGMEDGEIFFAYFCALCAKPLCAVPVAILFCRTGARKLASSVCTPYFILFFSGKNLTRLFLPFI